MLLPFPRETRPAAVRGSRWLRRLAAVLLAATMSAALAPASPARAEDQAPIDLRIVGGLASVSQYVRYEAPFWTDRVPGLTNGRVRAEIAPFDRSGIRGQEMLQLLRLGVVPFGTVLVALASADEPAMNALDLPLLNPDLATLRQSERLWRPYLEAMLRERYGIELLAVYIYPAQVMFCRDPFTGLGDLTGRRIRVSSVSQSELIQALGATPVVIPFADVVSALRGGVVQCAVTGTLSGNAIGLHEVTSYVSRTAISWGASIFGANQRAWRSLPEEVRSALRRGLGTLQEEIWRAAELETEEGLACNAGRPDCTGGVPARMTIVEERPQDRARRQQLLKDVVLPAWVERCGADCAEAWNRIMSGPLGIQARVD